MAHEATILALESDKLGLIKKLQEKEDLKE